MGNPLALVIEDEYDLSLVLARALREASFAAEIVRARNEALEWLEEHTPALVLLDLYLPISTSPTTSLSTPPSPDTDQPIGVDILRYIRQEERLQSTRVITITAYEGALELAKPDPDATLMKPFRYEQLIELARTFLPEPVPGDHS